MQTQTPMRTRKEIKQFGERNLSNAVNNDILNITTHDIPHNINVLNNQSIQQQSNGALNHQVSVNSAFNSINHNNTNSNNSNYMNGTQNNRNENFIPKKSLSPSSMNPQNSTMPKGQYLSQFQTHQVGNNGSYSGRAKQKNKVLQDPMSISLIIQMLKGKKKERGKKALIIQSRYQLSIYIKINVMAQVQKHFKNMNSIGPVTQTLVECLNRISVRNRSSTNEKGVRSQERPHNPIGSPQHQHHHHHHPLSFSIDLTHNQSPPNNQKPQQNLGFQQKSPTNNFIPLSQRDNLQSINYHTFLSQNRMSHNFSTIDELSKKFEFQPSMKPLQGLTDAERDIWDEMKRTRDFTYYGKNVTLDHKLTVSQKIAFQLEEQLQLAYVENRKLSKELEERRYEINHLEDKVYVLTKKIEHKDQAIESLSFKLDNDHSMIEDRLQNAISAKQKDIDMLNERLRKYQKHNDEMEKEVERLNQMRLDWESEINDLFREKEILKRQLNEAGSRLEDAMSQQVEYKQIIRHMSTIAQSDKAHSLQNKSLKTESTYKNRSKTMKNSKDEELQENIFDHLEEIIPNEVKLAQENQALKNKLEMLKDLVLNDMTHKTLKREASEIHDILKSLLEAVYQQRGLIVKSSYTQNKFDMEFIKDLADLESEVITIRDLQKIKRRLLELQSIVIIPKDQQNQKLLEDPEAQILETKVNKRHSVKQTKKPSIKNFSQLKQ
ncbi:UNKNOWN [Stylonychia lemnae]|uniref:Uncharacterized protein n=1 Tax=Stylonychia lemnae TaxID=5949 RepID=A0A078B654_STYLE|nr:UNKNOWN [Stylonychia lemnae]|eukprot:CDW89003.1 UNKNOWN [Stylonychia lemnae]